MTREELVLVVRDVLADGGCHGPCAADQPCLCRLDADAALTALCAALRIPPAALDALAAGEAVVVPARGGITAQMEIAGGNVLDFKAVEAMAHEEWHPDDAARRIYRAMVSASPYAAPDAEGGA